MGRSIRRSSVVFLFVALIVQAFALPASAANIPTTIKNFTATGNGSELTLNLDVKASVKACRVNRFITFYLKDGETGNVNKEWDGGSKYGTDEVGHLTVVMSPPPSFNGGFDRIIAKARKKTPGANVCLTDTASVLTPDDI